MLRFESPGSELLTYKFSYNIMSITYNPKKKKRKRTHGFLRRTKTVSGNRVIQNRRRKGRKKLTV